MTATHPPALEASDLRRTFGQVVAVDGLDLTVPRGAVYGFLGPNGAGKTTTIRMLLGLLQPDRGTVRLFGNTLVPRHAHRLLRDVGALVETPSLYPHLTGRENLDVTLRLIGAAPSRSDEVLELVDLQSAARRPVSGYSLGMRQRLALALALLGEPKLVVLDEPTNGLDPAGIRTMRNLIRSLARDHGLTVLLSSHLLAEVEQVATHVGIVLGGRSVFQGTLEDLARERRGQLVLGVDRPDAARQILEGDGHRVVREVAREAEDGDGARLWLEPGAAPSDRSDVRPWQAVVNARLVAAGVAVDHLAWEQPSLEALFLRMTEKNEGGGP